MTSVTNAVATTYIYKPLPSPRHIRLLCCNFLDDDNNSEDSIAYSLVEYELHPHTSVFDFEAVSYQWGDLTSVSGLHMKGEDGCIGLTANLTAALRHVVRQSRTMRLWIGM